MVGAYMVFLIMPEPGLTATGNWKGSISTHGESLELREKRLEGEVKAQLLRLMRKMLGWKNDPQRRSCSTMRG